MANVPKLYEARLDCLFGALNPPKEIPRSIQSVVLALERPGASRVTQRNRIKKDSLTDEDVRGICGLFDIPETLFDSDYFVRPRSSDFVLLRAEFMAAVRAHWNPIVVQSYLNDEQVERAFLADQPVYGGTNISREKFWEWHLAYPRGFIVALKDQELVAGIGLFPVTERWAAGFYEHKYSEETLTEEDIRSTDWTVWYFSGLASHFNTLNANKDFKSILGRFLLDWMVHNADRIETKEVIIVAEGTTEEGRFLLSQFFPDIHKHRGAWPRYRWKTSLAKIKRILIEDVFFKDCHELRRLVLEARQLE
jgi:hypothetical protein